MLKVFVLIGFAAAACNADAPVTTSESPALVRCGQTPYLLHHCLGNPKIVNPIVARQCTTSVSECERMKCVFRTSGWLDGETVNTKKVTEYFDQFAKDHPEWGPVVEMVKTSCLSAPLPAQGVDVNCAPYDVIMCTLTVFVKNAPSSVWSPSERCIYSRQFAVSCPLCPSECFAPTIPYGSCNACVLLPRSP